jgi:hypothetical protein
MKTFTEYNIFEGLSNDIKKFFANVFKTQEKLIQNNKIQPINVDVNKLNKPKHSFNREDLQEKEIKQIIASKHTGFTVANQMLSNENKYFKDNDKEYNPECYPYFYKDGKKLYCVGLLMFDKNLKYIDEFITLQLIESSMIISKSIDVDKAILNDFENIIKKEYNNEYKGIAVKPVHPKLKAIFIKLGFTSFNNNKEILTYPIK